MQKRSESNDNINIIQNLDLKGAQTIDTRSQEALPKMPRTSKDLIHITVPYNQNQDIQAALEAVPSSVQQKMQLTPN